VVCVVLTGETDALCDGCEIRQPCAVFSEADGQWYRGELMNVDEENDEFRVLLVDVGGSEKTKRQCLRLLQRDLMTSPVSLLRVSTQFTNRNGMTTVVCLSLTSPSLLLQVSIQFTYSCCRVTVYE